MGAGILPFAVHNNQIFLLLGKESGSGGWSDFGGGREKNESLLETAIREGTEELNGFLGTETEMRHLVKENTVSVFETKTPVYRSYLVKIPFNSELPKYFKGNFKLMNRRLKNEVGKHNGLFEKSEVKWFTLKELKHLRMRKYFYYHVYPLLLEFIENLN